MFNDVHKENMFTNNLEDGREAHSKASITNFNIRIQNRKLRLGFIHAELEQKVYSLLSTHMLPTNYRG